MTDLVYAPASELARIRSLGTSAEERAALFANVCRLNALYMIARAGSGHIGTTCSCLDVVSWLFLEELRTADGSGGTEDVYFSSKGHDVPAMYAVMIGTERLPFEQLHTLRQLDGLPGHPDVGTPGIAANTGSLGMGISKAKGMVLANRLQGKQSNIYVLTGDGELQEGQFWESLQSTANRGLHEITVIVDHNKVQSDTLVERVSDLGDLEAKLRAFGWAVGRCDGHDLAAFNRTLEQVRTETTRPKIIIADTVKGKGVSFAEHTAMASTDRLYKFHSGAPDAATYERMTTEILATINGQLSAADQPELDVVRDPFPERSAPTGVQRLVSAYSSALVEQAAANPKIVALDADLVLDTGLLPFEERFPERFVECGIAEQDMVSQASGLALRGMLPVVHSFACFLSTRPNEQIYNQTTERTKVVYVGSLAGIVPGGPGHSHQSVRDISALGAMPGMVLIEPSCEAETTLAAEYALGDAEGSVYLRLVSIPCRVPYELPPDYRFELGKGVALTEGEDAVLIGYGPVLLPQSVEAAGLLRERGIGLKVVNLPWLNRVDREWLHGTIDGYPFLFTLDNHYVAGGQGEFILSQVAQLGHGQEFAAVQLGVTEIPACGTNDQVLKYHGLDAASLADRIASVIGERTPAFI